MSTTYNPLHRRRRALHRTCIRSPSRLAGLGPRIGFTDALVQRSSPSSTTQDLLPLADTLQALALWTHHWPHWICFLPTPMWATNMRRAPRRQPYRGNKISLRILICAHCKPGNCISLFCLYIPYLSLNMSEERSRIRVLCGTIYPRIASSLSIHTHGEGIMP
jgi:hypothetical protein